MDNLSLGSGDTLLRRLLYYTTELYINNLPQEELYGLKTILNKLSKQDRVLWLQFHSKILLI